ncbi:major facilitator superfamily domain-containing protein 9-like isoform X1 [Eriocheir sinensis]|uniref:major facilitator superfamily domain-containing protein 9-like isoform X1 n=2 Tax=Eriocheir sinensis TaxID=95602 RepID=UPI0021C9BEE5|nr:major facilitator superfamily domain-containing protein 9-like isoform X1 [Eriocheir sinensis]
MRPTTHHIIYVMGFLDLMGVSLILPLIMPVVKSLGTSHFAAGCITSLYGAIQLLSSPLAGWLSDGMGRRPVLLLCTLATALSYVLLGISNYLLLIIFARVIAGVFKHSQTMCRAVLVDITRVQDRSQVFGTFNATSSMGFIVGPMLGGHLSELNNGFTVVCNLAAVVFVVVFALCYVFIPEKVVDQGSIRDVKKKSKKGGICQSLSFMNEIEWDIFWDVFLIRFFLSFSSLVYRTNFSLLINEKFGVNQKIIGYLLSFQGIISAMAGFFTGRVSRLYQNPTKELFHSSILLCFALLGLSVAPSLPFLVACLVPLCISSAVIRVSSSAVTIGRCKPSKVGSVTGFGQSIASVARMVTPMVAGAAQQASLHGPGLVGTLSASIGASLAGWVSHETKLKEL